jgi:membrane protease YdiL (CAAX protease family)
METFTETRWIEAAVPILQRSGRAPPRHDLMLSLWRRLPILVRAVITGLAVASAGTLPWAFFVTWNQRVFLSVPWAVLPMTLYLWLYWRYLNGSGWPRTTAEARRTSLRANGLSGDVWGMSLLAGMVGLAALLPLLGIMSRLVRLPAESQAISAPPHMPVLTVFLLLVMGSVVAGVVEEAGFRGYMQGPIERRHGPVVAILLNGALFGVGHYTHHPASVVAMLPYYLAVAAVYGGLAYATNSILPAMVLHAGGDVLSLTRLWATGQPEWQVSAKPPALIWETGADAAFWGYVAAFVLLGTGAVWAYAALARAARAARA